MDNNTIEVVSVDEVVAYLGIDVVDDMARTNIVRSIKTADAYLKGSIGEDYPLQDPRAKELALLIVSDLYDTRTMTVSNTMTNNIRRLVDDLSMQLRLDIRRTRNESNI